MKIERNKFIKLIASDEMMLTDGEHYGKVVYLPIGDSTDDWSEITEQEFEAITAEKEKDSKHNKRKNNKKSDKK